MSKRQITIALGSTVWEGVLLYAIGCAVGACTPALRLSFLWNATHPCVAVFY
jgi:hypothetical protein